MKTKSGGYTDQTDWHNVVVWQSENLAPYLTKGRTVLVEGRLHSSTWESNGKRPEPGGGYCRERGRGNGLFRHAATGLKGCFNGAATFRSRK